MKPLSAKQEAFVAEYARTRCGAKAARRAGYNQVTAGQKAWTLLNDPKYKHVQEALRQRLADKEKQREYLHQLKLDFLIQTINFDIGDLKDENGEWRPLDELDPEDRRQIASLQDNAYENEGGQKGRSISMKFANKLEAVKILAKHDGFFTVGDPVGETAAYRAAEEDLAGLLDRVRRRVAAPIPGVADDGTKANA